MDFLEAIQKIPGNTAKEKYQAQHQIIQQVIESKIASSDSSSEISQGLIPEKLTLLIVTEVAKILKNSDDVVAALKSEDFTIVNRALQAKWFFDGSNKTVTNFTYFATHIFPEVSINTRTKIIKLLSQHLSSKNEHGIAQGFFEGLSKSFALKAAMPLLTACSENYIWEFIQDKKVLLPEKMGTRIFPKYPELVIKFLKSRTDAVRIHRNILPRLIKNYINDFISIVKSTHCYVNLGNKLAKLFLKREGTEAVVKYPGIFLEVVTLELASKSLNKEQFQTMFRNLFPKKQDDFSFDNLLKYLEFQPEESKLFLITTTFRDLYGVDLITVLDKVTVNMMLMLPEEDRVNVVQKNLAKVSDSNIDDPVNSWICYLSTRDSIPQIKNQISKSKEVKEREALVDQLIYTCKVNNCKEDLLLVLEYISTHHRNEIAEFWFNLYDALLKYFDLALLSADHWKILNKMIERSSVNNGLLKSANTSENLLVKAVHYNLLNNIPIYDPMSRLTELNIKYWNRNFSILPDYPMYEKQCLEKFMDIIPRFLEDYKIWDSKSDHHLTKCLLKGLYGYNEKIIKVASKKQKAVIKEDLFSLTNYSWLLEIIENIILSQKYINTIKDLLQNHERKLYDSWFPPKEIRPPVFKTKGLYLLKHEPKTILENWEAYLESCKENINSPYTRRFIKKCTWYKEIPIRFAQKSLKKVNEADPRTLMILALLLQGPEFVRVIEPMMPPVSGKMDVGGEDAKKSFRATSSLPRAINLMNPPPSLELVCRFFQGDYVALGLASLMSVAQRVSVSKVIDFVTVLLDKPISVKKHGIRLMCFVAQPAELGEFLKNLWKTETHKSIREVIFQKSYKLLKYQPCEKTWLLLHLCIEGLTPEDVECIQQLKKLEIPKEYIADFYKTSLNKIEKLGEEGFDLTITTRVICRLIRDATWESNLPEEYCRFLVQKFAFDLNLDPRILLAGQMYAIDSFLLKAHHKIESRLTFFYDLLTTAISNDWNKPHPENDRYYPTRKWFRKIVNNIVYSESRKDCNPRISKTLMNLFSSILEPTQDAHSFLFLFFIIQLKNANSDLKQFGLLIGQELPKLVECFSARMLLYIACRLHYFLLSAHIYWGMTDFIGSFLEVNSAHCATVATLLFMKTRLRFCDNEYKNIVGKLRTLNYPAVKFLLNSLQN